MNEKQAIEIIKAALDLATSKGVFTTLNDCQLLIEAYNFIYKKLDDAKDDGNINQ